jgi:hypothetical protein
MSLREGTDQAVGNSSDLVCDFQELVAFLGVQITEALGDTNLCLHLQQRPASRILICYFTAYVHPKLRTFLVSLLTLTLALTLH